jgi:hypothetical protein
MACQGATMGTVFATAPLALCGESHRRRTAGVEADAERQQPLFRCLTLTLLVY